MNAVDMVYNGEVAAVSVNGAGRVEIARSGMGVEVLPSKHTLDTVVNKFKEHGWVQVPTPEPTPTPTFEGEKEVEMTKSMAMAVTQNIPVTVQTEVDEYLKLHAHVATLNKQLDAYKKSIRNYMEANKRTALNGTEGKQVYLQDAKASNSTSMFTDYELGDVMVALADNDLLRQVTEVRINATKLEGLLALDKLPREKVTEIQNLKIVKPGTPRFSVKK